MKNLGMGTTKEMDSYIKKLSNDKTRNVDPGSVTDLAASLEQLSSGIYTEDERFVFELLQNAVDAFEATDLSKILKIHIEARDNQIAFIHNGREFSRRDIEGLCSVGYGAKGHDTKKIGYKGIGFKSVFMHSDRVVVRTGQSIFRFDKDYWADFFEKKGIPCSESGRKYAMPWQIIPILTAEAPFGVSDHEMNVATYLRTHRVKQLSAKIEGLLSDSRFLLFLGQHDVEITFVSANGHTTRVSKRHSNLPSSDKDTTQGEVSLASNGVEQSRWLFCSYPSVEITAEERQAISHDSKTPDKLKKAHSFDTAFAIRLGDKGQIEPLKNAKVYTYLPTSFGLGLDFLVNANFITDAGRQQLNRDAEWNAVVISRLPHLFLRWIAQLSPTHRDFYKVLPLKLNGNDLLSSTFNNALEKAVAEISFIPTSDGKRLLRASKAVMDQYGLQNALSDGRFERVTHALLGSDNAKESLIDVVPCKAYTEYGVKEIASRDIFTMLEKADEFLQGLSVSESIDLCKWLRSSPLFTDAESKRNLGHSKFLLDESWQLVRPCELFFASKFKDDNSMAKDAKVLLPSLADQLSQAGLEDWLKELGVQQMSNLSVIKNVLLAPDYITTANAVEVTRFIFDVEKKEKVMAELSESKKKNMRLLTGNGNLLPPDNLFLPREYKSDIQLPGDVGGDFFVSPEYLCSADDPLEWRRFFKEFGVADEIRLTSLSLNSSSAIFRQMQKYVDYALKHEYNHSDYTGGDYYMIPATVTMTLCFSPLLELNPYDFPLKKAVWNQLLPLPVRLSQTVDYIKGCTGQGWYQTYYATAYLSDSAYLGQHFLPWAISNYPLMPGTDGELHKVGELLAPTEENRKVGGSTLPVLDVDCQIDPSWQQYLKFKAELTLDDCLKVLSELSYLSSEEGEDKAERISYVYSHIASHFDIHQNRALLSSWGRYTKIRLADGTFALPREAVLVSDALGRLELDGQMYKGRHIASRDNRFAEFAKAIGVRFIDKFEPHYEGASLEDREFKDHLKEKCPYIALLVAGTSCTKPDYEAKRAKTRQRLDALKFVKNDAINLCYGEQKVPKLAYADGTTMHFVGRLGMGTLETLHTDIAKALSVTGARTELLALMQMHDPAEIHDYLQSKGYPVELLPKIEETFPTPESEAQITMGIVQDNGLAEVEQTRYNEEARKLVKERLESEGYRFAFGIGDYSVVEGVTKDGIERPLVVKSHLSNRSLPLNPAEWEALHQPHSMLWVHFGERVINAVTLDELIRDQDRLTFSFSSENLANDERLKRLTQFLRYFKKMTFDIDSLKPAQVAEKHGEYDFDRSTDNPVAPSPNDTVD